MGTPFRLRSLWTPVIVYMAFIFALSSISRTPATPHGTDKILHAMLYAGLGALVTRALAGGWGQPITIRTALLTVAIAALYGVSDEAHQYFVPLRSVDALDVVADAAGGAIAGFGLYLRSRPAGAAR